MPTQQPQTSAEERAKFAAEAAKLQAEARTAVAEAETAELELMDAKLESAKRWADDEHNHVFHFETAVHSTQSFRGKLAASDRLDPDADWTIIMNSPGGSVIDGMALFDDLVTYSKRGGGRHHLTIKTRGFAASMGGILLQAADVRMCGKESVILVHEVSAAAVGKVGEMEDEMKLVRMFCDRIANVFVARADGKITKRAFENKWRRTDWWLSAEDSLKNGFIDAIG